MTRTVRWFAFTTAAHNGLLNVLKNECSISKAFDPLSGGPTPQFQIFNAIWDTGATNSVITQNVVDRCGLVPTGMAQVHGVHGPEMVETYLVNLALPNQILFPGVRVSKGQICGDVDLLIGMDIINHGDFAVTNMGGITKFSFRMPSLTHIDFVIQGQQADVQASGHTQGPKHKTRAKHKKTHGRNKKKR